MQAQQVEITFEEQAEREIKGMLSPLQVEANEDKSTWHAALFLMDYQVALNTPNTTAEHFLAAYANRALAIRHCRPEEMRARRESLDLEAYRLRQEWRKGKGA